MKRFVSTLVLFGFLISCKQTSKKMMTVAEPVFKKEAEAYLIKTEGDTLTKLDLEIADDDYQHQTGLMYRTKMEKNQGMLFVYEDEQVRSFYMKNTRISLDIIYMDKNYKVIDMSLNASLLDETSLPSKASAQYVMELNGKEVNNLDLRVGDRLKVMK